MHAPCTFCCYVLYNIILYCYIMRLFLKVKWQVYSHYLKSIGWFLSISTIVMNAIFQSFSIGSSVWLSVWSNDNLTLANNTIDTVKRDMYLGVYGALGFGQGMFLHNILNLVTSCSFDRQIRLDYPLKFRVHEEQFNIR